MPASRSIKRSSTKRGSSPRTSRASRTSPGFPLPKNPTSATTILTASLPSRSTTSSASMPRRAPRANPRSWPTTGTTSTSGPRSWRAPSPAQASRTRTWCRTPTATACSPAVWAPTTAPSAWALRSSRSPAATRRSRSCFCRTSAARRSPARRPLPFISTTSCAR